MKQKRQLSKQLSINHTKTSSQTHLVDEAFELAQLPVEQQSVMMPITLPDHKEETVCSALIGVLMILIMLCVVAVTFPFSLLFCLIVVHDHERAVVFRNGKLLSGAALGPGVVFVIPCVDRYCVVDLRTSCYDVPPQQILTKDSITVVVDAVLLFHISNAIVAVTNVEDYGKATKLLAASTLRNILGTRTLADILSDSFNITHSLRSILDNATNLWGVEIERIELKNVRLPQHMQQVMAAEAKALREARAKLAEANGEWKASRVLLEAANVLYSSPFAIHLRYLQSLSTISTKDTSTIVLPFPTELFHMFHDTNNNNECIDNDGEDKADIE